MDKQNPLSIVRHFSAMIQNGRHEGVIFTHALSEMKELSDELKLVDDGLPQGDDGIVGESIDVIACMLDMIFFHAPETTDEQINEILLRKCEKWARRYGDHHEGDRSID